MDFRSVLSECRRLPSMPNLFDCVDSEARWEPNKFLGADRAVICELQRGGRWIMRSMSRARRLGAG